MDRAFNGPIVPTHTLARSATPKSRPVTVIDLPPVAAATPGDAAWTTGVSTHETETFADSSAVDTAASSCSCVPNAPARSATDPSATPVTSSTMELPWNERRLGTSHVAIVDDDLPVTSAIAIDSLPPDPPPCWTTKTHLVGDPMGTDKPPRSMRTDVRDPPLLVNAGGYAFHAAAATRPFESESEESKDSRLLTAIGATKSRYPTTSLGCDALDRHVTRSGTPSRLPPVDGATHVGLCVFTLVPSAFHSTFSTILAEIPTIVPKAQLSPA